MVKQVDLPPVDSIIEEILPWAVRYAITRPTYANPTTAEAVIKAFSYEKLTRGCILCIQRDICDALERDTIPAEHVEIWRDRVLPAIRKRTGNPLVLIGTVQQIKMWKKVRGLTNKEVVIAKKIEDILNYSFPEVVGIGDFYRRKHLNSLYENARFHSFAVRYEDLTEFNK